MEIRRRKCNSYGPWSSCNGSAPSSIQCGIDLYKKCVWMGRIMSNVRMSPTIPNGKIRGSL